MPEANRLTPSVVNGRMLGPMVPSAEPSREPIGQRIRRLRLELGLSQRALSEPGVSYAYISRIESGTREPSVKAIRKIARKLGVSPDYLETGVDLQPAEERELRLADAELRLRLGEQDAHEAEETLGSVLREAQEAGDADLASRAHVATGLHAAHSGRHGEAIEHLDAALASPVVSPLSHPRVYTALGDCYRFVGRPDEAATVLRRALDEIQERAPEDQAARIRFASKLSEALSDLGEFEQARRVLEEVATPWRATDPYSQIRVLWSLARLAAMEGRPRVALRQLRRAITLLETTEDSLQLARAHLLCADILLFNGEVDPAAPHLEAADRLFELGADQRDLGSVRAQQAHYAARKHDAASAIRLAREALDLLKEDPADQATAWLALGLAHGEEGEVDEADAAFRTAVDQLEASNLLRDAYRTCREWTTMLRASGRTKQALDVAERAAELAARAIPAAARNRGDA